MAVNAYLNFNGNALEAVDFYADVFQTEKQKVMLFGDVPEDPGFPLSEGSKKRLMHTFLNISGSQVMFSDFPEGMPFTVGNNVSLVVGLKDPGAVKSAFDKLSQGGEVRMELQETFWSKLYGYAVDKFGVGWQINLEA
jgi:PhnB protein